MARATAITSSSPAAEPNRAMIVASVMLAAFMPLLDTTVANVVLPQMQGSLSATRETISWVLTSYIVASAIMMPLTAWAATRIGRRRLFLGAIVVFTVASMLCGLAANLGQMIVFRLLQGASGAILVPLSQAIILDAYPKERHGQMMAIWGAGIMIGPILGPTLGGWLADAADWRWVFYINLPVGILAFLTTSAFLEKDKPNPRRFDLAGFIYLLIGLGALQLMLDRGELKDWFHSNEILIEAAIAASGLWMFAVHAMTVRTSLIDLRIFLDRNYAIGSVMALVLGFVLVAVAALLPTMMQSLLDYPTLTSGIIIAPRGVGTMLAMIIAGRTLNLVDPRSYAALGFLLISLSLYQMTKFDLYMDTWPLIYSGFIQGLGMGLGYAALTTISFSTLAAELRADGAAISSLMRNLGSSIGVSLLIALLSRNTQINHAEIAESISAAVLQSDAGMIERNLAMGFGGAVELLNAELTRQALMIAYLNNFKLMMFITLAAAPLAYLMDRPVAAKAEFAAE